MRYIWIILLVLCGCATQRGAGLDESRLVDMTHPFDENTVYWPTARQFELDRVAWGVNRAGWWYASNDYCTSEHGGTHIDAPLHFAEGRWSTADIPVERLIGPARVIDVRDQCSTDRSYLLTPNDIERHEARYGRIEPGDIVLVLTGFGRFYPDLKQYLGSDVRGRVEGLSFPGIGAPAAKVLVDREIDMVGLDSASLDHGPSTDFAAHRVLNGANIPGLENIANLETLPATGATLIALPMKIAGGSGGPCRIVAILP